MKRIIIMMLSRLMVLSAGCSRTPEDPVISDVDYDKYLLYQCELPQPLYYPSREDFTKDGVLDHESWSIATVWGIGYKFEVRN